MKDIHKLPISQLQAELNQLRGFRDWEKSLYAQDLIKEIDFLKKIPDGKYCKIIGVCAKENDFVDSGGCWKRTNNFVKSFENGEIVCTCNENEAKLFNDDIDGTRCMKELIKNGMTHILVWYYNRFNCTCMKIQYPSEYWECNGHLEPLLLHHTVSEYHQNPY